MSKLYLVTGASSGIGLAICQNLLIDGYRVIGIARKENNNVKALLEKYPDAFFFYSRDLSKKIDEIPRWMKELASTYGSFSGIVCAAGLSKIMPNRFNTYEQMLEIFNLNLFSSLAVARGMTQRKVVSSEGASIIFIASVAATIGTNGLVNYGASKAGVIGAVKSLAKELAPMSIRVNSISPGLIKTELTQSLYEPEYFEKLKSFYPLGLGCVDYVADSALFLLSDKAKWITGIDMVVDGGVSLGNNE
ncbi:SDR family oxidoreductase [Vibrio owensii]|uniref:SDR family NAD(P)-dependent oxidoreductase n=1 Tax=Vibrio owensii TaxID=696485 RepID=UPI0033907DFE